MASKDKFNLDLDYISRKVKKNPIPGSPTDIKNKTQDQLKNAQSFEQNKGSDQQFHENEGKYEKEEKTVIPTEEQAKLETMPNEEKKIGNSPEEKYKPLMDSRSQIVKKAYENYGTQPVDKTINRDHKVKDTFGSIFPTYGLYPSSEIYLTNKKDTDANWSQYEGVNKEYFNKMDHVKRYTEAMLKVANMRINKK